MNSDGLRITRKEKSLPDFFSNIFFSVGHNILIKPILNNFPLYFAENISIYLDLFVTLIYFARKINILQIFLEKASFFITNLMLK